MKPIWQILSYFTGSEYDLCIKTDTDRISGQAYG
jgi:hypothetical protein